MTCNDCGRDINDCDRYGCREVRGTLWDRRAPSTDTLVDALQDKVHEDVGKVRPGRSSRKGK